MKVTMEGTPKEVLEMIQLMGQPAKPQTFLPKPFELPKSPFTTTYVPNISYGPTMGSTSYTIPTTPISMLWATK